MRFTSFLFAFVCLVVSVPRLQAQVFLDNFDDRAELGASWVNPSGDVSINSNNAVSPENSLRLNGANAWAYTRAFQAIPLSTAQPVRVSFDVLYTTKKETRLVTLQNNAVQNTLAGVRVNSLGEFQIHGGTGAVIGRYNTHTWYTVTLELSLQQGTYDLYIAEHDGTPVGSALGLELHSPSVNFGTIYFYNDASSQTTYIDNVKIELIPEPSSAAMLGIAVGAGSLLTIWGRKRK